MISFSRWKDWIWPEISHAGIAKEAARQGFWIATFIAVFNAILSIFGHFGIQILQIIGIEDFDLWGLLDSALFAIIAWRIWKMSRIAAIAGLALYGFGRIDVFLTYGTYFVLRATTIIFAIAFLNSIRGTFAYHKFIKKQMDLILNVMQDYYFENEKYTEKYGTTVWSPIHGRCLDELLRNATDPSERARLLRSLPIEERRPDLTCYVCHKYLDL